jgi:hypothetical protein
MRYLLFFTTVFFLFIISSCTSNEIGSSKDVNPETIYFDYKVWGDETSDDMTIMLQYRFAGANGTTLWLDEPSKVEVDGVPIAADSSKMTGAFYELVKPAKDFTGNHSIIFTDINKKQYKEEFSFQPIQLRAQPAATVKRADLVFELEGLDPEDRVRVVLTDTSFTSEGINRVDTVKNGRIVISAKDLETVANGPVHLELIKEDEKKIKNSTREGGIISITYGLKRDFKLED